MALKAEYEAASKSTNAQLSGSDMAWWVLREALSHNALGGQLQFSVAMSQNAIIHPSCNEGRHVLVTAMINMPPAVIFAAPVSSLLVTASVDLSAPRACMRSQQAG